jgi:hypothetical protein
LCTPYIYNIPILLQVIDPLILKMRKREKKKKPEEKEGRGKGREQCLTLRIKELPPCV